MMNCKDFNKELPELILTPGAKPGAAAAAHLAECTPCTEELRSYATTFAALDAWEAPEPSAYFDQKMAVRLREEQAAPKMSWIEAMMTRLQLNTGRQFRPMMAGALGLVLALGGGGLAEWNGVFSSPQEVSTSATVNDLQILDRNQQAFQQLDLLQEEGNQTQPAEQPAPGDAPTT